MNREFKILLLNLRGVVVNFAKAILWFVGYLLFLFSAGWSMYPFAIFQKVAYEKRWIFEGLDDTSWDNPRYMEEFLYIRNFKNKER